MIANVLINIETDNVQLLDSFTRSISHNERSYEPICDHKICFWKGGEKLIFPWAAHNVKEHGIIEEYCNNQYFTCYNHGTGGIILIDFDEEESIYWFPQDVIIPYYEYAAPFRFVFQQLLRRKNTFFTHAASVGINGLGALIVGKGGSGKTTMSLACLNKRMQFVSDDYCLTQIEQTSKSFSIYSSLKVNRATLTKFNDLHFCLQGIEYISGEKDAFFLYPKYEEAIQDELEIRVIIHPVISDTNSPYIEEISSIEMLKELLPSTVFQLPKTGRPEVEHFSKLVKKKDCIRLFLSSDLTKNVGLVKSFLS